MSYFLGNDPAGWRPDVPAWKEVRYAGIYPGLDLLIDDDAGQWRWRFLARSDATGAPAVPRLRVEGAAITGLAHGAVRVMTPFGERSLPLPKSDVGLQLAGIRPDGREVVLNTSPDAGAGTPLAPDDNPSALLYSTFLGGSEYDFGLAVVADRAGNAYVTGSTSSTNFPTTPGAFRTSSAGSWDIFVAKLNPGGANLVYATYIGGGSDDIAYALALDPDDALFVAGGTDSTNFPTTPGAYDTSHGSDWDAFVLKLAPAGNSLIYSTFLGGDASEIADGLATVDGGSIYAIGETFSANFPTTAGAWDTSHNGGGDGFVVKLNSSGSAFGYATFVGGNGADCQGTSCAIAVDAAGAAYITGRTDSGNFPTTGGAYDTSFGGAVDGFVAKLNPSGSAPVYSTFLGGANTDYPYDIIVDGNGSAIVTGATMSTDFPTTPGAYLRSAVHSAAFLTRFNNAGSGLVFSTYVTGGAQGFSVAFDPARGYSRGRSDWSRLPGDDGGCLRQQLQRQF